jgi:hypothetical protein
MVLDILNKIFIVLYIMSCLNTIRHLYYFIQTILTSVEEETIKYRISNKSLLFLCISISYVLSGFFTGITIN